MFEADDQNIGPRDVSPIPHTATKSGVGRELAVTFIDKLEIILQNSKEEVKDLDRPVFKFQAGDEDGMSIEC